jgi:hypothetical protein
MMCRREAYLSAAARHSVDKYHLKHETFYSTWQAKSADHLHFDLLHLIILKVMSASNINFLGFHVTSPFNSGH